MSPAPAVDPAAAPRVSPHSPQSAARVRRNSRIARLSPHARSADARVRRNSPHPGPARTRSRRVSAVGPWRLANRRRVQAFSRLSRGWGGAVWVVRGPLECPRDLPTGPLVPDASTFTWALAAPVTALGAARHTDEPANPTECRECRRRQRLDSPNDLGRAPPDRQSPLARPEPLGWRTPRAEAGESEQLADG